MLRVVEDDELPGDLAVACDEGEFLLFVTRGSLERRPLHDLAHEGAHMLHGMSFCGLYCRGLTSRIETCLASSIARVQPLALLVLALAHLA
jgi:hypothetical protein